MMVRILEYFKRTRRSWVAILLAIPLFIYFIFGLRHLTQFETADEYRWSYPDSRIPRYWQAMENKDWKDTMINDKPGIATAIISGLGMKQIGLNSLSARFIQQNDHSQVFNPEGTQIINFAFRFPLLAINGFLAILWYFLLRRLLESNWTALFACSLILLSPILLGISQIVNPDTMLWPTAFTAIISFILFLKCQKWYDALISGLFLGFALLSKYVAIMIIPYEFALVIAYLVFSYDKFIEEKYFRKRVIQFSIFYSLSVAVGILVYALLAPAVLQLPFKSILNSNDAFKSIYPYLKDIGIVTGILLAEATIFKCWILKKIILPFKYLWNIGSRVFYGLTALIFSLVIWNWNQDNFFGVPSFPFDAGQDKDFGKLELLHKIFLEMLPFVFSLTPIILLLLLLTLVYYVFIKKKRNSFVVFALIIFLPFFYFAIIKVGYLTTIRYSIMLYPLIATVAAVGIIELLGLSKFKTWMSFGVFSVVIWASVLSLKAIQPFYFNYANDLLPKNKVISSAWGYGGYEAAQFINKQTSNPENLIVWTDYDGFCPFFKGLCIKDSEIKWVGYKTTNEISYYVVTPRGSAKLKSTWDKMRQNIDEQPVWRLEIGNRPDNFIQVYKVIRSDFTTDNWWRDKEPEPAAAIQPGRSVKINAGAKSSAKVIPKKQK